MCVVCVCVCVYVRCVWGGRGDVEAKSKLGEIILSMTLAKRYFHGHGYFSLLTQNSANSFLIVLADTEAIYRASCKEGILGYLHDNLSCK